MDEPSRHLFFHGALILFIGLLTGVPYAKAIIQGNTEFVISAWRVAHSAISIGAILLLALAPGLTQLVISLAFKWVLTALLVLSAYAFAIALIMSPIVEHRGVTRGDTAPRKIMYYSNMFGVYASMCGAALLLAAAWLSL
ncbi:MAG: hypothetical protein ABFS45_08350 [Pseudomonadota bacterium]